MLWRCRRRRRGVFARSLIARGHVLIPVFHELQLVNKGLPRFDGATTLELSRHFVEPIFVDLDSTFALGLTLVKKGLKQQESSMKTFLTAYMDFVNTTTNNLINDCLNRKSSLEFTQAQVEEMLDTDLRVHRYQHTYRGARKQVRGHRKKIKAK